jgi:hypothetical protein
MTTYEQTIKKFPEVYDAIRAEYNDFEEPFLKGNGRNWGPEGWPFCLHFLKLCRSRMTKHCNLWLGEIKHDIESPSPSYTNKLKPKGPSVNTAVYTTYIHKGMVILAGLALGFKLKNDPTENPDFILANWMNIDRRKYNEAVRGWHKTLTCRKVAMDAGWKAHDEAWCK